ncbi:MAG TPA: DsrE family protein [Chitinophagaceae bacterium]|nr:DsrE family protein [Chitinophagaceae bacterium]
MKRIILFSGLLFTAFLVQAQNSDYRVVFDMTSKDSTNQQALVRQMSLISKSNADAKLEAVIYGQGLDIVIKGKTAQEPALAQLMANKNVTFKVCEATMKRNNIDRTQLIPGVEVVPDGIYEIITKQKEGWGYIKVAH